MGDDGDGQGCAAVGVMSDEEAKHRGAATPMQGDPTATATARVGDYSNIKDYEPRDYSEQETQHFLERVWELATVGPVKGLLNIRENSQATGPFDFAYTPLANSTWNRCGRRMNAAEFGNYVAGFQGAAYDLTFLGRFLALAQPMVELAGVTYHATGNTSARNDPWDRTGMPDIKAGELGGWNFAYGSAKSSCR